jgi:tetratricopeptide (TPR) repeat protein
MGNSDPRDTGSSGGRRSVNRRQQVLGLILAVLALAYGAYAFLGWHNAKAQKQTGDDYSAFMAAVAKADTIADPLQRCLSYPDLPGSHWDSDATRAYCVYRNHETVKLQDIDALLKAGKGEQVDRIFQGYLDTQLHDPGQPGLLDMAFYNAGFEDVSENTRRVIDLWKQQSPRSAFALAASGVQYESAAEDARGEGWGKDLSDKQVDGMNQQTKLAFDDFHQAVSINHSITAVYPSMIHGAAMLGDDAHVYQFASLGLSVDPANYGIRVEMMNLAQPQWGSEFGGLSVQRAKDLSLTAKNPLLRLVAQGAAAYQADCDCLQAQVRGRVVLAIDKNLSAGNLINVAGKVYDGDRRLAVELYSEALRFDPTDVDALRWRSQEMIALGDRQGATTFFATVAERFPANNAMATELGNVYAQAGDAKDAEAALLAVLQRDPDNYYAMGVLGDLYNHAGHQPDKAEALADTMIKEHPEKAGGYIVRSCNQMDHNLPGVYDTIHYFIDHFGDDPQWKEQTAEMRGYLLKHPENIGA